MKTTRIIICDGHMEEARFYEALCRKLGHDFHLPVEIKLYQSGAALLFDIDDSLFRRKLDVVFLALSPEDSVKAAASMRKMGYGGLIILLGGAKTVIPYEKLFDNEIFDFVRKERGPKHMSRFTAVFLKAVRSASKMKDEKMVLSRAGEIRQISISDILYFKVRDKSLVVYYGDGEQFTFICPLSRIEDQLKGRRFIRSSRSFLVSADAVERVTYTEAHMRGGAKVPVGRKYYAALKNLLEQRAETI